MHIVIIIPTFNERDNIKTLIPALKNVFNSMQHTMSILVVDDTSPDGTAAVVREFMSADQGIHLLMGAKEGLGKAYARGMNYALNNLNADAVMEMDADFSHKPSDVPRLIRELESNDFVIGSRYAKGGKIPADWGLFRKLNSRLGNVAARYIAGINNVKDCTAGFRAIRAPLLRGIELENLKAKGYCFQISLLHKAVTARARIVEVPVEFVDRKQGTSKLGLNDIIEFLLTVWVIRLYSSAIFIKFAVVGLSGAVVNIAVFTALLHQGVNKFIASPVAIETSIITNFFLNNYWTFRWRAKARSLSIKGLRFNIVSLLSLAVSYSTFVAVQKLFPGLPLQAAQCAGILPAMAVNYFLNTYWTFGREGIPQ